MEIMIPLTVAMKGIEAVEQYKGLMEQQQEKLQQITLKQVKIRNKLFIIKQMSDESVLTGHYFLECLDELKDFRLELDGLNASLTEINTSIEELKQ